MNLRVAECPSLDLCSQKIEVTADIGLTDMLEVKHAIAAVESRLRRRPFGSAPFQFLLADQKVQPPSRHVQFNQITIAHKRQGTANVRFRCNVKHAGTIARAAHAGIADAHHVAHALCQQFLWNGQLSPLWHAGRALRTRSLQHDNAFRGDVQVWIINALSKIVVILEDNGLPGMDQQRGIGRGRFDNRTFRGKVAA
ncbi:hypothetical protein CF68_31230 [Cupriavidus sp. SK-4]|nr:hypothetical protein CF68_31230 [Cupriavidus sp. SK-4]